LYTSGIAAPISATAHATVAAIVDETVSRTAALFGWAAYFNYRHHEYIFIVVVIG